MDLIENNFKNDIWDNFFPSLNNEVLLINGSPHDQEGKICLDIRSGNIFFKNNKWIWVSNIYSKFINVLDIDNFFVDNVRGFKSLIIPDYAYFMEITLCGGGGGGGGGGHAGGGGGGSGFQKLFKLKIDHNVKYSYEIGSSGNYGYYNKCLDNEGIYKSISGENGGITKFFVNSNLINIALGGEGGKGEYLDKEKDIIYSGNGGNGMFGGGGGGGTFNIGIGGKGGDSFIHDSILFPLAQNGEDGNVNTGAGGNGGNGAIGGLGGLTSTDFLNIGGSGGGGGGIDGGNGAYSFVKDYNNGVIAGNGINGCGGGGGASSFIIIDNYDHYVFSEFSNGGLGGDGFIIVNFY